MIRDHYSYLLTGEAHLALIPGLALASLVLAFMAIGTALRDVLDVKTSK
jgi:peptide/nickel transport system permease protein